MKTHYSIEEMSELTGLSAHTLRYYERIGLIDTVDRLPNGRRRYREIDRRWIEFLLRLKLTKMPIEKMSAFASLRREGEQTIAGRRQMLETHLKEVKDHLLQLEQAACVLAEKIEYYRAVESSLLPDIPETTKDTECKPQTDSPEAWKN